MKERIKAVRKSLSGKVSQTAFAEMLGTTRPAIASYETGSVTPNDTFIQLLCSKFNIDEHWLRTGEGDMYAHENDALMQQVKSKYHLDTDSLNAIQSFINMPEEIRASLLLAIKQLYALAQPPEAEKAAAPEGTAAEADEQTHTEELTADEQAMLDDYRARRKKTAGSESAPPYGAPIGAG